MLCLVSRRSYLGGLGDVAQVAALALGRLQELLGRDQAQISFLPAVGCQLTPQCGRLHHPTQSHQAINISYNVKRLEVFQCDRFVEQR